MAVTHQRVVLLSMPRTGSTMVTRRLSGHPQVRVVGDLFNDQGWKVNSVLHQELKEDFNDRFSDVQHRIKHHKRVLTALFDKVTPNRVIGLKHHLSGASVVTDTLVSDPSIAKIMLRRPNVLASYSSGKIHLAKKNSGAEGPILALFKKGEFERFLRNRREIDEEWLPRVKASPGGNMVIDYDEARTEEGFKRILEFMGVDAEISPAAKTEKRNSDDITSRFTNPDEVWAFLKENGLEEWASET